MVAKTASAQLVTDPCLPLTGLQLEVRALSLPAELQTYIEWIDDIPSVPATSVQLPGSDILTRSWWALQPGSRLTACQQNSCKDWVFPTSSREQQLNQRSFWVSVVVGSN